MRSPLVDLHIHSTASDGADSPSDLMDLAREAGVTTVALVDHDTLDGLREGAAAATVAGIRMIPGVELSVDHDGSKVHLLGYFVEPGSERIESTLARLRRGRDERNVAIVRRLVALGYRISDEDVARHARGPSIGRPHIADALVEAGYFPSRDAAFEHLLHDGGPAYEERPRLAATTAIDLLRSEDAVPVVAHPATITVPAEGYRRLFGELADAGLGGIEAHHPMHAPALRTHLAGLAADLSLAATGGSDYHGAGKRTYRIGTGNGDLLVPPGAVDALEAQRGR